MVVHFGGDSTLQLFAEMKHLVHSYDCSEFSQQTVAQAIYGGCSVRKKTNLNKPMFSASHDIAQTRLGSSLPEEVGLNSKKLSKIDSILTDAILAGAMPGCQVLVAKNGNIVYNKSFGFFTYSRQNSVRQNTIYDLASVSKIAGATMAMMRMYDKKKLSLNTKLGDCFTNTEIEYTRIEADTMTTIDTVEFKNIKNIIEYVRGKDTVHLNDTQFVAYDTLIFKATPSLNIFKRELVDLLRHESGIIPVLPILPLYLYKTNAKKKNFRISNRRYKFLLDSLDNDSIKAKEASELADNESITLPFDRFYLHLEDTTGCEVEIAENMFLRKEYYDSLWLDIKQLGVFGAKVYQYSDVNMILLQQAIDSTNGFGIDKFLNDDFFQPLGLKTTGYLPLKRFHRTRITPTEIDRVWRNQLVHGYVHDPSAAFLGGVSGNAGLFSNAEDLGVLFQMLLNGGTYGGRRYLQEKTINLFTEQQPGSMRGLGFDKPTPNNLVAASASEKTFGHTGFTGTCVWVDPVNQLVFIFLSNRLHPSAKNWKLVNKHIIRKTHQAIYDAFR